MRFLFVIPILLTCFDKTILFLSILLLSFHFSFYVNRISGLIATLGFHLMLSLFLGLVKKIKSAADLKKCIESTVQTNKNKTVTSINSFSFDNY